MPAGARRRLLQVDPRPSRSVVYRVIGSRFLASPLATAGSRERGGRFNPPGAFEVLYVAASVDTAFAERDGLLLTAAGIRATRAVRSGMLLRLDCRLGAVLDTTEQRVRDRLAIGLADLLGPWLLWTPSLAPSQAFGEAVHASRRFEGILYPSTKDPAGCCLAIFPDRLRPSSSVTVRDPDGVIRGALGIAPLPAPKRTRAPRTLPKR
jgi:RES domain-containing protein